MDSKAVSLILFVVVFQVNPFVESAECPYGFTAGHNSCYFISTIQMTWEDARQACLATNSYLAEVTSTAEDAYLSSQLTGLTDRVWLGATDVVTEGVWIWNNSGSVISAFDKWQGDQPDNRFGTEHCLAYKPNLYWADVRCFVPLRFICESSLLQISYDCFPNSTLVVTNPDSERFQRSFANGTSGLCTTAYSSDFSELTVTGCQMGEDILLVFINRTEDSDVIIGGEGVEAYILRCNDISDTGISRTFTQHFSPTLVVTRDASVTPYLILASAFRDNFVIGSGEVKMAVLTTLLYWTIDTSTTFYSNPTFCTVYSGTIVTASALNAVLIQDGCSQDTEIVGNFGNFLDNGIIKRNWAQFYVFKYYDSNYITIQCSVVFCQNQADCTPSCSGRRKREATGPVEEHVAQTTLHIVSREELHGSGASRLELTLGLMVLQALWTRFLVL